MKVMLLSLLKRPEPDHEDKEKGMKSQDKTRIGKAWRSQHACSGDLRQVSRGGIAEAGKPWAKRSCSNEAR
ncbi:hypothetical protein [Teichococcus globiformis]|uniref:hypothetical protein n=1 Tax=Teichococcus globiformis TaxID=2307229 RepID=UPI0036D37858